MEAMRDTARNQLSGCKDGQSGAFGRGLRGVRGKDLEFCARVLQALDVTRCDGDARDESRK